MTRAEFQARLTDRARLADVRLDAKARDQLQTYFSLLARWNEAVNLTSLPVKAPTDDTIDRLLVEPLAAARHVEDSAITWVDVGSGAGSPALPLKILRPLADLVMVESKARKAAFLNEAVRRLGLKGARVDNQRFEQYAAGEEPGTVHLVTIRAVRPDIRLLAAVGRLLRPGGELFLFGLRSPIAVSDFKLKDFVVLTSMTGSNLGIFELFHVEH